jgi:hypothetical protein
MSIRVKNPLGGLLVEDKGTATVVGRGSLTKVPKRLSAVGENDTAKQIPTGGFRSRKTDKLSGLDSDFLGVNSGQFGKVVDNAIVHMKTLVALYKELGRLGPGGAFVVANKELTLADGKAYKRDLSFEMELFKKYYQGTQIGKTRPKNMELFQLQDVFVAFVNAHKLPSNAAPDPLLDPIIRLNDGTNWSDAGLLGKWFSNAVYAYGWNAQGDGLIHINSPTFTTLVNQLGLDGKVSQRRSRFSKKSAEQLISSGTPFTPAAFIQVKFTSVVVNAAKVRNENNATSRIVIANVDRDENGLPLFNEETGEVLRTPTDQGLFDDRNNRYDALDGYKSEERQNREAAKKREATARAKAKKQAQRQVAAQLDIDMRARLGIVKKTR